jgi:hypothetical protein
MITKTNYPDPISCTAPALSGYWLLATDDWLLCFYLILGRF